MSFKIKGLSSRVVKRRRLSQNQVAAKERLRVKRVATAETRLEREIADAQQWERDNPAPKLPPATKVRIEIPGLPVKVLTIRRWPVGGKFKARACRNPNPAGVNGPPISRVWSKGHDSE